MSASAILDAAVTALAARYPTFTVEAHGGQFTERELPLLLGKAPALLATCAGVQNLTPSGETAFRGDWRWALYVLALDSGATDRAPLALETALDLLLWLPNQRWNRADAWPADPEQFSADNLYTGHVNTLRVALWGVTWSQSFLFAPE